MLGLRILVPFSLLGLVNGCGGGSSVPASQPAPPTLTIEERFADKPAPKPPAESPAKSVAPERTASSAAPASASAAPNKSTLSASLVARRRLQVSDGGTCLLGADGALTCWGAGGQSRVQGPFMALTGVGEALTTDGRLVAASASMKEREFSLPMQTDSKHLPKASHVVVPYGGDGCLIRATDSTLFCWGTAANSPPPPGAFVDLQEVRLDSGSAFCGLSANGTLACWSEREAHQAFSEFRVPTGKFKDLGSWCALRDDGSLACWLDPINEWARQVPKLSRIYKSDYWSICGLDEAGNAGCWGRYNGRAPVATRYDFVEYAQGRACGLLVDRVECWGRNEGGLLDPPPALGSYVAGRPYPLDGASLAFDATVAPLPDSKPAGSCKELALEAAPAKIQALGKRLTQEVQANVLGKLNLARSNSSAPLLLQCGAEFHFRWFFVSFSPLGMDRSDITLTVPSAASLEQFRKRYEAERLAGHGHEPSDSDTGQFTYASKWRGQPTLAKWNRQYVKDSKRQGWKGLATLTAELDGYLATEVTTSPSSGLSPTFNTYFSTLLFNVPKIAAELKKSAEASAGPVDAELVKLAGKYPRDLFSQKPELQQRLNGLLGAKKAAFELRFNVQSRLSQAGDWLIGEGCQQHICISEAAVFVLNLRTHQLYAGIVSGPAPGGSQALGVAKGEAVPEVLTEWMSQRRAAIREAIDN